MRQWIRNSNIWMSRPFTQYKIIYGARRLLYGWLLLQLLILLPDAPMYFGPDAIIPTFGWSQWDISIFLNLFQHPLVQTYYWLFLGCTFIVLILGLLGKWPRVTSILIFFFAANLINRMSFMTTGGEILLRLLLFYLMFADEQPQIKPTVLDHVRNRMVLLAARWNIVLVYILAGWYKLEDPLWLNGSAVYWISQVETFSNDFTRGLLQSPWVYVPATYLALLYQLAFPFLVWVKSIKIPFLIIGALFHLFIAFGIGVFSFGIIMILSYRFFIEDNDWKKLWEKS